jgi:hypothetical protein
LITDTVHRICWSPELQIFIVVGNNIIKTSNNGIIWVDRISPENDNWDSVIWIQDFHIFIGCGESQHMYICLSNYNTILHRIILKSNYYFCNINWNRNIYKKIIYV